MWKVAYGLFYLIGGRLLDFLPSIGLKGHGFAQQIHLN